MPSLCTFDGRWAAAVDPVLTVVVVHSGWSHLHRLILCSLPICLVHNPFFFLFFLLTCDSCVDSLSLFLSLSQNSARNFKYTDTLVCLRQVTHLFRVILVHTHLKLTTSFHFRQVISVYTEFNYFNSNTIDNVDFYLGVILFPKQTRTQCHGRGTPFFFGFFFLLLLFVSKFKFTLMHSGLFRKTKTETHGK